MTARNSPTRIASIQAQAPLRLKSGGRLKSGKATCTISSRVNLLDNVYNEIEREKPLVVKKTRKVLGRNRQLDFNNSTDNV
jgi:hypothetical protein